MRIILLLVLLLAIVRANDTDDLLLWPDPTFSSHTLEVDSLPANPCTLKYVISSPGATYVQEMIQLYLTSVFKCKVIKEGNITLNVIVRNVNRLVPTDVEHEKYSIYMLGNEKWELSADFYPGFVRGLETFSQLFTMEGEESVVKGLPITIEDTPYFIWRALMIDTSRHFLPVPAIKKAIDFMMYSKLNVLHWHITDEDAFPMFVPSVPELSGSGSVGGVYSPEDLVSVINYARARGIRVVPQVDTPAHSESWGRSQKYKNITLNCNGKYEGQLDPTLDLTWTVLSNVLSYVNTTFIDDYAHFGGDEVVYNCWGNRSSIVSWMKDNNISDYKGLSIYFRQKQKKLWRGISSTKKVIYWANENIDLPVEEDDVIHWWGVSTNVNKLVGRKNQVILSNYDVTYLDIGFGNIYGRDYSTYQHWRKAYSFEPRVKDVNVIGGASCMWNELGNQHTFEQKVVQRASVIGERLWNPYIDIKTSLNDVASRLIAHTERLRQRGFKVWPVTVGVCETNPSICF